MRSPAEFRLELNAPPGWQQYSATKLPHRFGGDLLAAWEKDFEPGRGIIYVIGMRRDGQFLLEQVADSFEEFLDQAEVETGRFENFFVLGRPAVKFVMAGKGSGQMIAAISEDCEAKRNTVMQVVLTTNLWRDGAGTDFIQFVMACPKGAESDVEDSFKEVVHKSTLVGTHDPKAPVKADPPTETVAPAPKPARKEAATDRPKPTAAPRTTKRPSTPVKPPAADQAAPKPSALFGMLYAATSTNPRPVVVQFLTGRREGASVSWQAARDDKTDVYVCVWKDMRATWIIPASKFKSLADRKASGYELAYSEKLAPFLGQWDYLWEETGGTR